jgi:hypothetical protein
MTRIWDEWWLCLEESVALLHAIYPSWPEVSPRVHVDIEKWKWTLQRDCPAEPPVVLDGR